MASKTGDKPTIDIITLENLGEKLSPLDLSAKNHVFAVVDMGSNGIRFSITDLTPPRTRLLVPLYRERAGISLFDSLNASSDMTFPPATIAAVAQALGRFAHIARRFGVPMENSLVFATEAVRRAANSVQLLTAIYESSGLKVSVLAPEVETLLGAAGTRAGFVSVRGLFLDLGGGSVQMSYVDSDAGEGYEMAAARTGQSLPFGAARLIRVLGGGTGDGNEGSGTASPPDGELRAQELTKLGDGMKEAFARLQSQFPSLREATKGGPDSEGIDLYLCGGGFRGYGFMLMHEDELSPYPIPAVGSYTVSGDVFDQTKRMAKVNAEYTGKIYGMSRRRREQFPAIVAVVEALIAAVPRIRSATFTNGSNREGALFMKMPRDVRETNPLTLLLPPVDEGEHTVMRAVQAKVSSALPSQAQASGNTVFGLGLGHLFCRRIWARAGEEASANAAHALHDAVTRDPSAPGLSHLARAVLGLTGCARWGGDVGPADDELRRRLRGLVARADADAVFWAEYIGTVAAALAAVLPFWPRSVEELDSAASFRAVIDGKKEDAKIKLEINVSKDASQGIDVKELEDLFKDLGKKGVGRKVKVTITTESGDVSSNL